MPRIERMQRLIPALGAQLFVNRPQHTDPTSFHDHVFHEIAVVVGGMAVHQSVFGDEPLSRGEVVVIHPGQWHGYRCCASVDLFNLGLAPTLMAQELAWARREPVLAGLLPVGDPGQQVRRLRLPEGELVAVQALLERILTLQRDEPVLVRTEAIGLATAVLGRIARHLPKRHVLTSGDERLAQVVAQVTEDLARSWSLAELAVIAGLSREALCRRFRAVHQASPLAWLAQRRAERAAVLLLSTDATVAAIGQRVGWSDPNLFARRFRALTGHAPSVFRQRLGQPPPVAGV